jgi:tripartite-type tricarboxylate transporter receptor subunit TctC
VKKAPADGNTLLLADAQITLQPHLVADLGYDPFADFVPVAQIMTFDPALAINGQIPASSLETLAAWIKAAPERGNFGTPGEGTEPHLACPVFGRKFGLALSHVPYRGTPAALPDLISGRLPMFLASAPALITNHRRGDIRIVATLGEARALSAGCADVQGGRHRHPCARLVRLLRAGRHAPGSGRAARNLHDRKHEGAGYPIAG